MSKVTDLVRNTIRTGVSLACTAVVEAAATAVMFFRVPPVKFILNWLVNWVAGKLLPFLETLFVDMAIDIQVNAEKLAYEKARNELQEVLKSHVPNPLEQQNASDEFDKRLADLIRFRP